MSRRMMEPQIIAMPSLDCFLEITKAVPRKHYYTMRDVNDLISESLFHKWECGTLPDQVALACAAVYVVALSCNAVISQEIQSWFKFFQETTGALK